MHDNEPCKDCAELNLKAWCEYHKTEETWDECAEKQEMEGAEIIEVDKG